MNLSLRFILIGVLLQGVCTIYASLPKDRIVLLFINLLVLFILSYVFGAVNLLVDQHTEYDALVMLNIPKMLLAASVQLYLQYFIFSLVFPRRIASLYTVYQAVPILIILLFAFVGEEFGLFSDDYISYDNVSAMDIFTNPLLLLKTSVILLQFAYAVITLLTSRRYIKSYQHYIYCTESNASLNLTWINNILYLFFALSLTYSLNAFVSNVTTAVLYSITALYFFIRIIVIMMNNYSTSDNLDGNLYSKIGIKWSVLGIWQTLNKKVVVDSKAASDRSLFNAIDGWIDESGAYTNVNFSFRNLTDKFPDLDYNHLDELLRRFSDKNFQSYVRAKRIDLAIKLMGEMQNDTQIKYIAYKVGFENNSSFTRAFKATKGITPSQWRTSIG